MISVPTGHTHAVGSVCPRKGTGSGIWSLHPGPCRRLHSRTAGRHSRSHLQRNKSITVINHTQLTGHLLSTSLTADHSLKWDWRHASEAGFDFSHTEVSWSHANRTGGAAERRQKAISEQFFMSFFVLPLGVALSTIIPTQSVCWWAGEQNSPTRTISVTNAALNTFSWLYRRLQTRRGIYLILIGFYGKKAHTSTPM